MADLIMISNLIHGSGYTRQAEDSFRRLIIGFVVWLGFTVYWNFVTKDTSASERTESQWSARFNGIIWTAALLMLFLPVPGLTHRFLPSDYRWVAIGFIIQLSGTALALWARRHLGRNWSTGVRIAVDHRLVDSGPYRHLRHPIYTAMLCMFVGLAIQSGQLHSLLAIPLFVIRYWRKIRTEERLLEETFGAEYDAYRHRTWALVPYIY